MAGVDRDRRGGQNRAHAARDDRDSPGTAAGDETPDVRRRPRRADGGVQDSDRDRGQRLLEYAPQDFEIPPGRGERFTIVSIEAFAGRSLDAKRALYQEIVTRLETAGIPKADVFIVLKEVPVENWGLRGGTAACDLDLGFKVAV